MISRNTLVSLGKAIALEMRAGKMGDASGQARDFLAEAPEAIPQVLDLAAAEARKRSPKDDQLAAYMMLIGTGLESLRFRIEAGDAEAEAALASLNAKILAMAQAGTAEPNFFWMVSRAFAAAKLAIGEDLKTLSADLIAADAGAAAPRSEAAAVAGVERSLAELSQAFGGDSFAIAGEFIESVAMMPDPQKALMAEIMASAATAPVRDAALAWLFDPSPEVRLGAARALAAAGKAGQMSATTAGRLVAIRNWFPPDQRAAIDAAIEASDRTGAVETPKTSPEVKQVFTSAFDGAGAQTTLALLKIGRKHAVAALLLKQGFGVRDGWVRRDLSKAEAREFVDGAAGELEHFKGSRDFVGTALAHFLTANLDSGMPPPFGLIDVVEALGLGIINPAALGVDQLLSRIPGTDAADGKADREAVIRSSGDRAGQRFEFKESWFEADAEVAGLLKGKRMPFERRSSASSRVCSRRAAPAGPSGWAGRPLCCSTRDARGTPRIWRSWRATFSAAARLPRSR